MEDKVTPMQRRKLTNEKHTELNVNIKVTGVKGVEGVKEPEEGETPK